MLYYFIVNGRADKAFIREDLDRQLRDIQLDYSIYTTVGMGDATRFVRMHSEFHKKDEICFVACGGSGTVNEVASGLIGTENKCMAILAYGTTNDFIKMYPGKTFRSVREILAGEKIRIDAIKCNDDYAINVINIGFDAHVAYEGEIIEYAKEDRYVRGLIKACLSHRFNRLKITADGERVSGLYTLLCNVANGRYCGGKFFCSPRALNNDGLIDLCLMRGMSLLEMLAILPTFVKGKHLDSKFWRYKVVYRRCKKVEISSKDLIIVCLDGEIIESSKLSIEILENAVTLILPGTIE